VELVRHAVNGLVGTITIDRPEAMNAVSPAVLDGLNATLDELEAQGVRVCILTGAGEKAFSAGADLEEMLEQSPEASRSQLEVGVRLTRRLETAPFVTVAAVNGYALGGGTELALACDIRLASRNAKFGLPEVRVGIFPGWGGIVRLPRVVSRSLANDMILSGRIIDAEQALASGLVSEVADDVVAAARATAESLLKAGPEVQALARRVIAETQALDLDAALEVATQHWLTLLGSPERTEGHRAFLEKRPAAWAAEVVQ
jgi:enoyl-CoA hydratase